MGACPSKLEERSGVDKTPKTGYLQTILLGQKPRESRMDLTETVWKKTKRQTPPPGKDHPTGKKHFLVGPTRCNCSATIPPTDDVCPNDPNLTPLS